MNQEAQLPLTTTLNKILACNPCLSGWNALVTSLGKEHLLAEECPSEDLDTADDAPLKFSHILESNGLNDVLWSLKSAPEFSKQWRTFAVWSARQVQHLMTDARSLEALDVADKHIAGLATDHELDTARAAARAAAWDTAAWDTARAAAAWDTAAWDTARAAWAAARAAAAAWDTAAWDTAAWAATRGDAWDTATWAATRDAQAVKFLEIVGK